MKRGISRGDKSLPFTGILAGTLVHLAPGEIERIGGLFKRKKELDSIDNCQFDELS